MTLRGRTGTLERRATLLDAARRDHPVSGRTPDHIDAWQPEQPRPASDTPTPGEDEDYLDEWRDVLAAVLTRLDERIEACWTE